MKTNKQLLGGLIAVIILAGLPCLVAAAGGNITFTTESRKVSPGQEFTVIGTFDSGDSTVNAFSGKITVAPPFTIERVLDAHSIITLWIDGPTISSDRHEISFAGILPGGLSGTGELVRFNVLASTTGTAKISATDMEAYEQGQEPTPLSIKIIPLSMTAVGVSSSSAVFLDDQIAPEPFTITIGQSPDALEGNWFAAFVAHDKQSGIDHYEAAFTYLFAPGESDWTAVKSPFVIPSGDEGKLLWVRAVDFGGNKTLASAAGPGYYRAMTLRVIIIVLFIICLVYFVRRRSRLARR